MGSLAAQKRYDIIITEFLVDPTPSRGLPETEFIELKNRSPVDYSLQNWKISNGNTSVVIKSDYLLKADSFLILCSNSAQPGYAAFGPALGLSGFPALNNGIGEIILTTASGNIIHAISYDKSWFENEIKAAGGWSLEMIDPENVGAGKMNWTSSLNPNGGTPGSVNSVDQKNPDTDPPSLLNILTIDSANLMLVFSEAVDSFSAADPAAYEISDGIGYADTVRTIAPFFNSVFLHLPLPMSRGKKYRVSISRISDCSGNEIGQQNTADAGIPETPVPGDVIFNELLFNPPTSGYDYVELFNRSDKLLSISDLFIAKKDAGGSWTDPVNITHENRTFFPGDYVLLTENPDWIRKNYPGSVTASIQNMTSLPSMPDDLGHIGLLNGKGEIIDELSYDHHWHNPLVTDENGISLERIRPDLPTMSSTNWTSAAASAGYGTPGYKNSESGPEIQKTDLITIEPAVFSPDMDGYQDFLFIHYHLPGPGFLGSVSIYDITGRMLAKPVNNLLWDIDGIFRWDGLDEQKNRLPVGHYVIFIELFNPDGTTIRQKKVCTLAR